MRPAASKMQLSSSCSVLTFLSLFIQPHNKNLSISFKEEGGIKVRSRFKQLYLSNHSELHFLVIKKLILLPSKIQAFPPYLPVQGSTVQSLVATVTWHPGLVCSGSQQFVSENAKVLHHQNSKDINTSLKMYKDCNSVQEQPYV